MGNVCSTQPWLLNCYAEYDTKLFIYFILFLEKINKIRCLDDDALELKEKI